MTSPNLLGMHTSKYKDPREHRDFSELHGWGISQSNFGSAQSFDVPTEFQTNPNLVLLREPLWVWHAAYVAAAAPKVEKQEYHGNYLKAIARAAGWWNVHGIVVHTGATVGLDAFDVIGRILDFVQKQSLEHWLQKNNTKLIVEVAASISDFNCNPHYLADAIAGFPELGWCLDLAHVYGTGVKWERLHKIIKISPPTLVHVNFPGTYFASSCDVHGWRTQPYLYKDGRKMGRRSQTETEQLTVQWDETVRILKSMNIPMIVEGSSFDGDPKAELEFIREL